MIRSLKHTLLPSLCTALCISLYSCGTQPGYIPNANDYKSYLQKDEVPDTTVKADKFSAYFDFSGVYIAYEDSATSLTFNGIAQKVTGSMDKYDIYTLANDSVMQEKDITSGKFFAKLKDSKQQGKLYAPIEKTLRKILKDDQSALFVTDFEEYTPERIIYRQAYATSYFEQWIQRGKRITFFVTDYFEGKKKDKKSKKSEKLQGIKKHLYYAVFDDAEGNLLKEIYAGLEGCPVNYKVFTLSNDSYTISTDYKTPTQGGTYHDETGNDIVTASIEDGSEEYGFKKVGDRAEVYTFGEPWKNIVVNANMMKEEGVPVPFRHVFHNLFMDLSKFDSYSIDKLDVNVSEIGDDFQKYLGWSIAQKYPAEISTIEGEQVVEIPQQSAEYYNADGSINEYYDYPNNKGVVTPVSNLLVFSQQCFDDSKNQDNGEKTEIAIDLSQTATGAEAAGSLLRVDVSIAKASPKLGLPKEGELLYDLFNWEGNDCLYMSIKNVLQHSSPEGRLIYTYFINYQN